jgi:hypothetical protein
MSFGVPLICHTWLAGLGNGQLRIMLSDTGGEIYHSTVRQQERPRAISTLFYTHQCVGVDLQKAGLAGMPLCVPSPGVWLIT